MKHHINIHNYEEYALDYLEGRLQGDILQAFVDFLNRNPDIKEEINEGFVFLQPPNEEVNFNAKLSLTFDSFDDNLEINSENVDDWFIAFFEGDLSEAQKEKVTNFLQKNPEYINDFELYSKAKVSINPTLNYIDFEHLLMDEEFGIPVNDVHLISDLENNTTLYANNQDMVLYKKTKLQADLSIRFDNKQALLRDEFPIFWMGKMHRIANVASSIAAAVLIGFFNPQILNVNQFETPTESIEPKANIQNSLNTTDLNKAQSPAPKSEGFGASRKLNNYPVELASFSSKDFARFDNSSIENIESNTQGLSFADLEFKEDINLGLANHNHDEIITPMPIIAYAVDRVKSIIKGKSQESELEINWQNVAVLGINKISDFTNNDKLLALTRPEYEKNPIFILKKRTEE